MVKYIHPQPQANLVLPLLRRRTQSIAGRIQVIVSSYRFQNDIFCKSNESTANNQILFFFSAFFHVNLFIHQSFFKPLKMDADFSVDSFAIEVCEELRDGLKDLVEKQSFLAERERDSRTVEQMCFSIHLSLFSIYYIL